MISIEQIDYLAAYVTNIIGTISYNFFIFSVGCFLFPVT